MAARAPTTLLLAALLGGALAAGSVPAAGQEPVEVRGRIVDAGTGQPLPDVLVRLPGLELRAVTRTDGAFLFSSVPPGDHLLEVSRLGYGVQRQRLEVSGEGPVGVELRISPSAIELAPLEVEILSASERRRRASGTGSNEIGRAEILDGADRGLDVAQLLVQEVVGLRLRTDRSRVGVPVCLEFRGASRGGGACRSPVVYLDGVRVSFPSTLYDVLDLRSLERVEVVPPGEAGSRFGSGAWGAIVIETRDPTPDSFDPTPGSATEGARPSPLLWDWSREPGAHASGRVFGAAALGNGAGVALGAVLASGCFREGPSGELEDTCGTAALIGLGLGAVALPALGGSLAARAAGDTDASRGKLVPSLIGSAVTLIPAYALTLQGDGDVTGGSILGILIGALGTPLVNTLSDRFFRSAR